jgi:hypothetical protein
MAARTNKLKIDQKTKDEIRGSQLVNMLVEYGKTGKYRGNPVDPNRITAARSVLPFLRPTFSSVEQTIIDSADRVSESDLLSKLQALVTAYPDLVRKLLDASQIPADESRPTVQ